MPPEVKSQNDTQAAQPGTADKSKPAGSEMSTTNTRPFTDDPLSALLTGAPQASSLSWLTFVPLPSRALTGGSGDKVKGSGTRSASDNVASIVIPNDAAGVLEAAIKTPQYQATIQHQTGEIFDKFFSDPVGTVMADRKSESTNLVKEMVGVKARHDASHKNESRDKEQWNENGKHYTYSKDANGERLVERDLHNPRVVRIVTWSNGGVTTFTRAADGTETWSKGDDSIIKDCHGNYFKIGADGLRLKLNAQERVAVLDLEDLLIHLRLHALMAKGDKERREQAKSLENGVTVFENGMVYVRSDQYGNKLVKYNNQQGVYIYAQDGSEYRVQNGEVTKYDSGKWTTVPTSSLPSFLNKDKDGCITFCSVTIHNKHEHEEGGQAENYDADTLTDTEGSVRFKDLADIITALKNQRLEVSVKDGKEAVRYWDEDRHGQKDPTKEHDFVFDAESKKFTETDSDGHIILAWDGNAALTVEGITFYANGVVFLNGESVDSAAYGESMSPGVIAQSALAVAGNILGNPRGITESQISKLMALWDQCSFAQNLCVTPNMANELACTLSQLNGIINTARGYAALSQSEGKAPALAADLYANRSNSVA